LMRPNICDNFATVAATYHEAIFPVDC